MAKTRPVRGATLNQASTRFGLPEREADGDWLDARDLIDDAPPPLRTTVTVEKPRTIIARNRSPDIPFDRSINPYRGCEHGCVYCFARPSHAYLDLSPGLDFETILSAKTNAAERLRAELGKRGHVPHPIALGINTDGWQPIEREHRISRACLEVLLEARHPVSIVTKSSLIVRDIDLLAELARHDLVHVMVSVTTLDNRLSSKLEPRAAAPHTRLKNIRLLREAGVPVGALLAPIIPMITDHEIEHILEAVHDAGAMSAGYVLLRLPHELKEIWREWLLLHYPDRAAHVMSLIRQMRGGKDYESAYGTRMRGEGPLAQLIEQRFRKAHARMGFEGMPPLDMSKFVPPRAITPQGELF